jgi:hypothetical protein
VGVSVDTLHRHPEFAEVYKKGTEGGRKSLRRMQFESATKGNVVMQIWLGKQYLGQRDKLDQHVDTDLHLKLDLSKLDDAELAEAERLSRKIQSRTIDVSAEPGTQITTRAQNPEREGEPILVAVESGSGQH